MQTRATNTANNDLGIDAFSSGGMTGFSLNGRPILAEIDAYAESA
jgi:hypothetical protein